MTIFDIKLTKTSNAADVVSDLVSICYAGEQADNIAYLTGDEISDIHPRQNVQALPTRTAKILSAICRRGMTFHVATRGRSCGIFIAKHPKHFHGKA